MNFTAGLNLDLDAGYVGRLRCILTARVNARHARCVDALKAGTISIELVMYALF